MKARAAIIAIVVASIGAALVWLYIQRFEAEASGGAKVTVLMALHTLEPGSMLKPEDIGERQVPQAYVESRAILASDRSRVVNLRMASPIQAQQALMWTDIVVQNDDRRSVSALIQSGMRAVTIRAEGRAQALIRPGDRVDVIATMLQPGTTSDVRTGVVLLQNVLVLGRSIEQVATNHGDSSDVMLSLTLQQAQAVAVAGDKAKLTLALRATDDVRLQENLSDVTSSSLAEPAARGAVLKPKTGPVKFDNSGNGMTGGRP